MDKKRMVANEQKGYLELHAVIAQSGLAEELIQRRIASIPGAKGWLHSAQALMTKVANELTRTLPDEQRDHLSRQLVGLYMHVGVQDKIANQKRTGTGGRLMTFKELDVVADALRECCRMCSIEDPQQQKQCKYCKLLESLPTNKPDEDARGCGYFTMWM